MTDQSEELIRRTLLQRHGTIVVDNPTKAMIAVGKENTDLHEEVERMWRELDLYRDALTLVAYLEPRMFEVSTHDSPGRRRGNGGVDEALAKAQQVAKAALAQIVLGSLDLAMLRKIRERQKDGGNG
jgi:hypothetical protein